MDWTAEVTVGKAVAKIAGSGALNVGDLIAEATGIAGLELNSVTLNGDGLRDLMVGFQAGKSGAFLMAYVRIEPAAG